MRKMSELLQTLKPLLPPSQPQRETPKTIMAELPPGHHERSPERSPEQPPATDRERQRPDMPASIAETRPYPSSTTTITTKTLQSATPPKAPPLPRPPPLPWPLPQPLPPPKPRALPPCLGSLTPPTIPTMGRPVTAQTCVPKSSAPEVAQVNGGHQRPHERPLRVGVVSDSIGGLKSKGKTFVMTAVREKVRSQYNVEIMFHERFAGGDLPEVVNFFDRGGSSEPCDVYLIVLMSNYVVGEIISGKLSQPDIISEDIVEACRRLQKVAESVPIYCVYGGPGDMWELVAREGMQERFDAKTNLIRQHLARSGRIKVDSGINDFRAFFRKEEDLDYMGHILGSARERAINWFCWMIRKVSEHLSPSRR